MKTPTIRLIVILAALSITGITCTQFYWVMRAFDLRESEFDRSAATALFNVAQQLYKINDTPSPANNPVKQLSTNYFVVMVNSELRPGTLEFLLKTEFEKRSINTDFEYGIYDCINEEMVYGNYIAFNSTINQNSSGSFPKWPTQGYYFGVRFPNREAHLLNQMGIWGFSSLVMLIVIIFFVYTLFVILQQKRLSEIQKDFINNMTHEFKTPISTIAIASKVLKEESTKLQPERLHNYATIIERENDRLKQQVERVLQMAIFDKGKPRLKKEPVDIHEIIGEVVQHCSNNLSEKGGAISCDLQSTITKVRGDRLHLINMLINLVDNAIKYCTESPIITIRTSNYNNGLCLEVADNGIGISTGEQRRIFQKFYRVSTGNIHDVKGFGLGLNYVKDIVKAHGGRISLISEPNKGSTFKIFLS